MLEKFPLFSNLPGEHLARLEAISKEISVKKGSVLFPRGCDTGFLCGSGRGGSSLQGLSQR